MDPKNKFLKTGICNLAASGDYSLRITPAATRNTINTMMSNMPPPIAGHFDGRGDAAVPVCKLAGIAEKFANGDPITHNEIVCIWGLTYTVMHVISPYIIHLIQ